MNVPYCAYKPDSKIRQLPHCTVPTWHLWCWVTMNGWVDYSSVSACASCWLELLLGQRGVKPSPRSIWLRPRTWTPSGLSGQASLLFFFTALSIAHYTQADTMGHYLIITLLPPWPLLQGQFHSQSSSSPHYISNMPGQIHHFVNTGLLLNIKYQPVSVSHLWYMMEVPPWPQLYENTSFKPQM